MKATALAHPNIALAKYWGKRPGGGNVPAVPSLSVTLAGLTTTTTVTFDDGLTADSLVLDGAACLPDSTPLRRVGELLDRVRHAAAFTARASVVSKNDFPTASGLASSASGFAALALAATRAAGLAWEPAKIADLARQSSASAARSLFGGFVELEAETARPVAPAAHLDLVVLVCVTTESSKGVPSRDGMLETARRSPYYGAWLELAHANHAALREALLRRDFAGLGERAEESALAMHASALAAGVVYVSGATLDALATVRALRADGVAAYATIDAGPHLKCLVREKDVAAAKARLAKSPGVLRILEARPGEGARLLSGAAAATMSARARDADVEAP